MKKHYKLIVLLMIFGLFTACNKNVVDPATITISNSEFTVGAEQDSEAKATFSVNVDWTTSSISYAGDTKDWLTITPVAGKAGTDQTITMKASANPAEIARTASFTINYGGKPHKLTIAQLAKGIEPTITISTSEFTVDGEPDSEATATFSINVDWTTSIISYEGDTKDWLTITPVAGKAGTDQTITMKAAANPADVVRTASFTINYGVDKEHKLTITQTINSALDITAHFDAKFAARLQEKGHIPDAKKILLSDVKDVTKIDVERQFSGDADLTSLLGIEYFEKLTHLDCTFNTLTVLDLSKNTALTSLICKNNKLTSLDLSKNTDLTYVNCAHNLLITLDVTENTKLTDLVCNNNKLVSLNASKSEVLAHLNCGANKLEALDVSQNPALIFLMCYENQLKTLDVRKNIGITKLNFLTNQLTTLDLRNNIALTHLTAMNNKLETLDLSENTALTDINIATNQFKSLDVSKNPLLYILGCGFNEIESLDLSNNKALVNLYCYNNKLTALDVSNNTSLTMVDCKLNQITSLDVTKHTNLTNLWCNDNQLITIDISQNKVLSELSCKNNPGNGTLFVVSARFNNEAIPASKFTKGSWELDGKTITIDYQKVN